MKIIEHLTISKLYTTYKATISIKVKSISKSALTKSR